MITKNYHNKNRTEKRGCLSSEQSQGDRFVSRVAQCSAQFSKVIGWLGVLVLVAGCASVSVRKIDANGQATGPDGIRFYRPRPYVSVHEPFVISSKAYVAAGRLTADGRFIVLTAVPDELKSRIVTHDNQVIVESTKVLVDSNMPIGGSIESGNLLSNALAKVPQTNAVPSEAGGPVKTGQINLRVSNDNKAYAFQPGRKYFDIVFLADFDEDYVISAKARLGNASADIALGQGWSLQGMAMTVDNDELNKRIFTLMDDAQKILTAAARTAIGIPPIPGGIQAGRLKAADQVFKGGTPVSVKITLAHVVAPGLYKVLKSKELAAFCNDTATNGSTDHILVPVPPLTDIAFNTYEVMVLEAVPMAGDSPLRMHQAVDVSMRSGGVVGVEPSLSDLNSLESQANTYLESSGANASVKLTLSADGATIRVKLTPAAGSSLTEDQKANIIRNLAESLKGTGKKVEIEP